MKQIGRFCLLPTAGLLMLILLAACATGPAAPGEPEFSHDGLQRVPVRGIEMAFVYPGTDLSGYRELYLRPVTVAFDPDWNPQRVGSRTPLPQRERERIREEAAELFDRAFQREMQNSQRFRLVDEPGPGTLILEPHIVGLVINAPEDRTAGTRQRVYVADFGRMTLIAQLFDTDSGAVIARAIDRREVRGTGSFQFTNRMINAAEGERVFRDWARIVRDRLDRLAVPD